MKTLLRLILLGNWLLLSMASAQPLDSERVLTFGVVPQQAASKLARLWGPLLQYIGQRTSLRLEFRTAPDIPTFEQRLARGEYDLAYMNPYHYTIFHKTPGYNAFVKEKDKRIQGILVVRKDTPVRSLSELQGQAVAFPAPAAFAASMLPRGYLRQQGIVIKPVYVSSHDSVYRNVAKGFYPAGGGVKRTLAGIEDSVGKQLQVLWTTPAYTPHAFAAHPRMPSPAIERIGAALIALHDDPKGRSLLEALGFINGLTRARNADWDDVRALELETLLDSPLGRNQ